jgi:hypothetical protein
MTETPKLPTIHDHPAPHRDWWRRLLDVSTAHLCPSTREELTGWDWAHSSALPGGPYSDYGWLIWVPTDLAEYAADGGSPVPADLLHVLAYAQHHGAEFILFDRDAAAHDGLPLYGDDRDEPLTGEDQCIAPAS